MKTTVFNLPVILSPLICHLFNYSVPFHGVVWGMIFDTHIYILFLMAFKENDRGRVG